MRRFGSDRISKMIERLGMEEDVPIEHGVITKSIESAQVKVEGHDFDIRQHVVQYDDVMNRHREVSMPIAAARQWRGSSDRVEEMVEGEIEKIVDRNIAEGSANGTK